MSENRLEYVCPHVLARLKVEHLSTATLMYGKAPQHTAGLFSDSREEEMSAGARLMTGDEADAQPTLRHRADQNRPA